LLLLLVALVCSVGVQTSSTSAHARDVDLDPYAGLGTWVDVYDYVPGFQADGGPPSITPASVDDMAALGVRTLYLQAAQDDARLTGATAPRPLLGRFLRRAHAFDIQVIAWYIPKFVDVDADLRRIKALHRFRSDGEGFDGLALDIEYREGVPDPVLRNKALFAITQRARKIVGSDRALGAIVLEPLLLDVVNTNFWPGFPWKRIAPYYDVWLPMSYWTNRNSDSGLKEGFHYTDENVRLLRMKLGKRNAPVHVIGGIADTAGAKDYDGFVRAARHRHAIGWSVYDFNTTTSGVWARLRRDT
jgi:hypothetical protein